MIEELIGLYQKGAITADHLAVESLHRINPDEPGLVLSVMPREVLGRILAYAERYHLGGMKTNYGLQPASDQVAAATRWIESKQRNADDVRLAKPDCAERR